MSSRDSLIAWSLAAALLAIYAAGACRTIYVGDSGELVTAVAVLGIPHPSGYPLYVLLGKLFTLLVPIGSLAFRMSLFSAVCAAAACAIVYRVVLTTTSSRIAGITSALLLAFSESYWGEANVQRVYSLNAMFVGALVWLAYRWRATRDDRFLVAAFFAAALGGTNHTFMLVAAAVLAVFAVVEDRRVVSRWRTVALCTAAFAVGLLPYAYLLIRSRMNPLLDWGNPETPAALWNVITRAEFWDRRWYRSPSDLLPIAADLAASFVHELTYGGVTLLVIGIVFARARRWQILLPLLLIAANFVAMAFHGSRSDLFIWHRYYIPAYMMGALLAGLGAGALVQKIPRSWQPALLAVPFVMFLVGYGQNDRSRYRVAEDFSLTLLDTLPPGSTIIANDDNILFVLIYLTMAEGKRPDVDLVLEGVGGTELPPLRFDPDVDPIFLTHHPNWRIPSLTMVPAGLAFRAWRSSSPLPPLPQLKTHLDGELDPRVPKDYLTANLIGHFHYMLGVTFEERDWMRARSEFAKAMLSSPNNDVLFYNLGLIFARNGLFDEAVAALQRSDEINPRNIAAKKPASAAERLTATLIERDRIRALESQISASLAPASRMDFHRQMSARLASAGEVAAARAHRIRAMELAATTSSR